ncbi:MAG TPA: hypothetical protein VJZ69_05370 [Clostridia bacterium]|nr:hypothetical protein [Clostridia bacterium]
MKNGIIIGLAIGVVAATAIYQQNQNKSLIKRGKHAIVKKIEDILD